MKKVLFFIILIICISQVSALDLSDYPDIFIKDGKFNGILVIGDKAPSDDVIGLSDIISSIQYTSVEQDTAEVIGSDTTTITKIYVGSSKIASEVDNPNAQSMILIGVPLRDTEKGNSLIDNFYSGSPTTGVIKLIENGDYYVLIVTGDSTENVREATKILANYNDYDLKGTELSIDEIKEKAIPDLPQKSDIKPLIIVDDKAHADDVIKASDIAIFLQSKGYTMEVSWTKIDSEVKLKELATRIVILIRDGNFKFIVRDNAPSEEVILASDIAIFVQKKYGVTLPVKSTVIYSEATVDFVSSPSVNTGNKIDSQIVSQSDINPLIIVDDKAHADDVIKASDVAAFIQSKGYIMEVKGTKLDTEVTLKELGTRMVVLIRDGNFKFIVRDNSPSEEVILASDIAIFVQKKYGIAIPVKSIVTYGGTTVDFLESKEAPIPFIEEGEEVEITEEIIESSTECPDKSCLIKSEECSGKDKVIFEECKVYIKNNGRCEETKIGNSKIIKNECLKELPKISICQGCKLNEETCVPFGIRIEKDNVDFYCNIDKEMLKQKENKAECQNSYECTSNNCKEDFCSPICQGCLNEDNICIPFGLRTETKFCDTDYSLKNQKSESISCNNNYECSTNICVNSKCISPSFIQKIINWFIKLFG